MLIACTSCRTPVEIDPAQATPPGGWACPRCSAILPPATADATGAARREASAPSPELEAWLRRQLEALRAEIKEEIASELLARALSGVRLGTPGHQGPATFGRGERNRIGLVITDDAVFGGRVVQSLSELGYAPELVGDPKAAAKRLQQVDPCVVCVDQVLGGDPQGGFKILEWLNAQPGPRRRKIYVAFVSADVKSMDSGSAFVCGANLTVNRGDAGRLTEALRQGLEERDELYRVFTEVTEEVQG